MYHNRTFKLWFYQISHSEAIIRSSKDSEHPYHIDIYFGDVQYIDLLTSPKTKLTLEDTQNCDLDILSQKLQRKIEKKNVAVFSVEGQRFYVVASIIKFLENDLERTQVPIDMVTIYGRTGNYRSMKNDSINK